MRVCRGCFPYLAGYHNAGDEFLKVAVAWPFWTFTVSELMTLPSSDTSNLTSAAEPSMSALATISADFRDLSTLVVKYRSDNRDP